MMLTRCPACQTVFRLRPEQLHARRGEVRCGHCFHPFNALEHALETQAEPRPATAPPPAPALLILEERPAPPASPPRTSMLEFGIPDEAEPERPAAPEPERPRAPEPERPATRAPARPVVPEPEPEPEPQWSAARTPAPPAAHAMADTPPPRIFPGVLRSGRRPAPPIDALPEAPAVPPPVPTITLDATTTAAPAAEEPHWPSAEPLADEPDWPSTKPPADESAAPASEREEPDLARLDAAYGPAPRRTHPVVRVLGSLLALALTALLGAQTVYLYRTEIARELPGLRPLLTEACARIGCVVPYPQDAERIAIEASDLQAEPGRPGHYLLHATLNNRAEYPQRWPYLELTLTDAGDKPISRRVLAPAEWQRADEVAEAFPARTAIELRLPFQVQELAPTGYRIYAFYP